MSVAINIEYPARDIARVQSQIERASRELGKSLKDSVAWAGYFVASSLGASTKTSPKLRPVVKNPDKRAGKDGRVAPFGVMKYDRNGNEYFKPIYRTGEFGKIRFRDKRTAEWLVRDSVTGEVRKETWETGTSEFEIPGIMQDKRRTIGRRGLCKKAWAWITKHGKGGVGGVMDVPSAASVQWGGDSNNPAMTLTNQLRYAGYAFKQSGDQAVGSALNRAFYRMRNRIDAAIVKKMVA